MAPIKFSNSNIYLPTDDDLIHFLKSNISKCDYAKEWQSRNYHLKALWKTSYDFNYLFRDLNTFERKHLFLNIGQLADAFFVENKWEYHVTLEKQFHIEKSVFEENEYYFSGDINIFLSDDKIVKLNKLSNLDTKELANNEDDSYFLIYLPSAKIIKQIPGKNQDKRSEFISYIIDRIKSYCNTVEKEIHVILKSKPKSTLIDISNDLFKKEGSSIKCLGYHEVTECSLFLKYLVSINKVKINNPKEPDIKKRIYSLLKK